MWQAQAEINLWAHLGIFDWAEEMGTPHHLDLEAWPQFLATRATQQEGMIRVHVIEKALARCVLQERDGALKEGDLCLRTTQHGQNAGS